GHRDTTCVQWFKITDTESPEIKEAYLHSTDDNGGSNCDEVPLSLIILAREKNAWLACGVLEAEADPHDCKATVILPDPRAWVLKDCDDQLEVFYEIEYIDPSHPGKTLLESGTIPEGGTAHVYLPAGWHQVLYHIRDRCWNETLLLQGIGVYDNTPPTPVCDEITQVTLDPKECWARVYAKDLDDGSHDNCCNQLHFAVANMDSVTYWRNYWHDYILDCVGHSDYYANQDGYDTYIEEWINTFVFDDYIDVTECGSEQLVLRVYEACDLPVYDPHTFFGGEHEWYWYNHSILFQVFYLWKLDEYIHYGDPRFYYLCNNGSVEVDLPIGSAAIIYSRPGGNPVLTSSGYDGCNFSTLPSGSLLEYLLPELKKIHVPVPWGVCSWNIVTNEAAADWKARVFDPYRTEAEITKQLNLTTPYYTPVKYSDCMIEVLKDDKTPPVVVAPEDVTVYCDGVPYWWELTKPYAGGTKTATVKGHGAQYTHDVCEGEDALQTYCSSPDVFPEGKNTSGDYAEGPVCCVEIPWDGGDYGYYGGPVCGESGNYGDGLNCDGYSSWYSEHNWQPIYCRLWLMLDKYDNPDGGHPDPQRYFDETAEDWVITDNCWAPDTDVVISGSLNECGVGTLTKTVTATDKCGNTSHDTQTLYVKPRSDFEVLFPEDVVVNCTDQANLAADRTGAGYPEISDDDCELIGVTYSDERYDVTEGCYKILRTWKLIDWCVYSPDIHHRYPDVIVDDRLVASAARCCIHRNLKDDGDGYMTYLQVIKVVDDEAPVIVCNDLDETCIYDDNCDAATVNYELLSSGTDNCATPEEIQYRYTVLWNETTPVAYGQGHVLNEDLAVGDYGVWLVGKDRCGNEDSCYTTFTIRDCKKPTPYCYDGISTVVMSPSGEVEVWASDFDAGSYDNCTLSENLILSFTEDGETPSWTYTCADIPDGRSQEIQVTVWVIDEAGNKDFCTTTFILQDNSGNACPDNSPLTESGVGKANLGQTEKGEGIKTPELYQNTPNPFSGETMIGFWLPESTQATLRVMDVTGKELYRVSGRYSAGNHQLSLEAGSLPEVKGVLFYQLETKSGVINKRMVKVN
ncbi:MAG: T9SS type A sorting domain-containing protein, partial [Saprospiraceae bacterium]